LNFEFKWKGKTNHEKRKRNKKEKTYCGPRSTKAAHSFSAGSPPRAQSLPRGSRTSGFYARASQISRSRCVWALAVRRHLPLANNLAESGGVGSGARVVVVVNQRMPWLRNSIKIRSTPCCAISAISSALAATRKPPPSAAVAD
jgi:hypothetical protein